MEVVDLLYSVKKSEWEIQDRIVIGLILLPTSYQREEGVEEQERESEREKWPENNDCKWRSQMHNTGL